MTLTFTPTQEDISFQLATSPARDMRSIALQVSRDLGVSMDDLKGLKRLRHIVHARQYAMWKIRQEIPGIGLIGIGLFFNRDHSTVLHAIRAVDDRIKYAETCA